MLPAFDHIRPISLDEAVAAASAQSTMFLAGGQGLFSEMARGIRQPARLIDLTGIRELTSIQEAEDAVVTGALVKLCDVAGRSVPSSLEILSLAAARVGSEPIRTQATIGGNLCYGLATSEVALAAMAAAAEVTVVGLDGQVGVLVGEEIGRMRPAIDESPYLITTIRWPAASGGGRLGADFVEYGEQRDWLPALVIATVVEADRDGMPAGRIAIGIRGGEKSIVAVQSPFETGELSTRIAERMTTSATASNNALPAEWVAARAADSIMRAAVRAGGDIERS